jgi:hypothetical protein
MRIMRSMHVIAFITLCIVHILCAYHDCQNYSPCISSVFANCKGFYEWLEGPLPLYFNFLHFVKQSHFT